MKSLLSALLVASLCACGASKPVDFKEGVPTDNFMSVNMPSSAAHALNQQDGASTALEGQRADLFNATAFSVFVVNGTTLIVLGALKSVMDLPPTSIKGNVAVWGPHTPALSPTTWKLTVTRTANNAFSYILEGKPKGADDTEYKTAMSGNHVVSVDANGDAMHGFGHGSFLVQWGDTASNSGQAEFDYARNSATEDTTLNVSLTSGATTLQYAFSQTPDEQGTFDFVSDNTTSSGTEHWSIRSRWEPTGEGRSDVQITGPSYDTPATTTECWDANFNSTYLNRSYSPAAGWGSESACVYATAEYSSL